MITTLRQETFPEGSAARTVTVVFPIRTGTVADQLVVPVATPEVPKLVAHVTRLTATLSLAVPLMVTDAAVVDMVAEAEEGDPILSVGGVVSAPQPAGPVETA
jgi:hypothetical protein